MKMNINKPLNAETPRRRGGIKAEDSILHAVVLSFSESLRLGVERF
jgi:hypothetical protein